MLKWSLVIKCLVPCAAHSIRFQALCLYWSKLKSVLSYFFSSKINSRLQDSELEFGFIFCSSEDPHKDVSTLLEGFSKETESDAELEKLLPSIVSTFTSNKSVSETVEELKKCQSSTDHAGVCILYLI
jgi:hypothetical protein